MDDFATLKNGSWWDWENKTRLSLYRQFTENLRNASFSVTLHIANSSLIAFPYPIPKPHRCPNVEACKGGLDGLCLDGYSGPLCAVCMKNYYKQLGECKKCPPKQWMMGQLAILGTTISLLAIFVIWRSKKQRKENTGRSFIDMALGIIKIIIGFYQVTFGIMVAFSDIKWPKSLSDVGKYSKMIQFNILQIVPLHCIISSLHNFDAFEVLIAVMALNGAAIIVAFSSYLLYRIISIRKISDENEKKKVAVNAKEIIQRNLFFFLYVTYLNTCLKIAEILLLTCHKICLDDEEKSCKRYLRADYSITCSGPRYNQMFIVGVCCLFYVAFLPTATFMVIWRQKRASVSTDEQDNVGLRFLHENYKPHCWYWELVETFRKVVLTSGLVLIGGKGKAYIGAALVLSGLYGVFFAYKSPIFDPLENKLMLASLAVTFLNLGIGAVGLIRQEDTQSFLDAHEDNVLFNGLVFGANSLLLGILFGENLRCLYYTGAKVTVLFLCVFVFIPAIAVRNRRTFTQSQKCDCWSYHFVFSFFSLLLLTALFFDTCHLSPRACSLPRV